jgi:hypothetical protein
MVRELEQHPEAGLPGARLYLGGPTGGSYECVYNNMPPIGLGEATSLVPAAGRKATAAGRAGIREEDYPEGAPTEGIEV